MKYQIIAENDEYLVVDKPAGLLVHRIENSNEPSLCELVLKDRPEIVKVGDDPNRPGLVHRLDKLVSGLIVIAKNQESFDNIKSQFQNRTINKYYTALVYGKIEKEEDEILFPITRSSKGYKMAALPPTNRGKENKEGRKAITEFVVAQRFINYTLLNLKIKTGRTHQIRVHMSAYGHPLVGDDLYGTKKTKIKNKKLALDRIFLVAYKLSFKNLAGEKVSFSIEIPDELTNLLKIIK